MLIRLTIFELYSAGCVGLRRRLDSIFRGLNGKFGYDGDGWATDLEGAMAEMAVAKALNVYWDAGVGTFKSPDVGNIQVRSTTHQNGSLIVRGNDDPQSVFVLVTGKPPTLTVEGWIKAIDGQRDEWKQAPNGRPPAWFIPRTALLPISELLHRTPIHP